MRGGPRNPQEGKSSENSAQIRFPVYFFGGLPGGGGLDFGD